MDNNKKMNDNQKLISLWANDSKRKEFLEAYKEWENGPQVNELDLQFYFYALNNGDTIIAMEHNTFSYFHSRDGELKRNVRYYLRSKDQAFIPNACSIWNVADKLKEEKVRMQKEMKNQGNGEGE